jgi:hypothetical protein
MQNDYRRLQHAFDKSAIANFPWHKVELGENTRASSVAGCTSRDLIIDDVRIASQNLYISSQIKICDEFVTNSIWS